MENITLSLRGNTAVCEGARKARKLCTDKESYIYSDETLIGVLQSGWKTITSGFLKEVSFSNRRSNSFNTCMFVMSFNDGRSNSFNACMLVNT